MCLPETRVSGRGHVEDMNEEELSLKKKDSD